MSPRKKEQPARREARHYGSGFLLNQESDSVITEAYRVLRTNLLLSGDGALRTLVVTSSGSGEGKSITVANLGLVLSMSERRVVIVDADLRLASQHHIFDIEPGRYPLILTSEGGGALDTPAGIAGVAVNVADGLDVIPAGPTVSNPSEVLEGERFDAMLRALAEVYDIVLVDSPPAGLVTDAAVLATRADGVLFVLDWEHTHRRFVRRAMQSLRNVNANVIGGVVNRYPMPRTNSYGSSYYTGG